MYMIVESSDEALVREFMQPFAMAGTVDVYPAATCAGVVSNGGCGAAKPDLDRAVPDSIGNRSLVLFDRGDEVIVHAGDQGIRFLLVSGKPLEEPVAWYGPIVMNTQEELQVAMAEMQRGTFIKTGNKHF